MKKLFLFLSAIALFVSCNSNDDYSDSGLSKVTPGILMYNTASLTNMFATDGASVALRLEILLSEMEAQGLEVLEGDAQNWNKMEDFTFPLVEEDYNLKEFLFNKPTLTTNIAKNGNIFTITYGDNVSAFSTGQFDSTVRSGSLEIDTKGVSLLEATASNPWTVTTLLDKKMVYIIKSNSSYSPDTYIHATNVNLDIWCDGNGSFSFISDEFEAISTTSTSGSTSEGIESDWSSIGNITIPEFVSFALEDLVGSKYQYTINEGTGGTSFSGLTMNYVTGGLGAVGVNPITYNPSKNAYYIQAGTEEVELTGTYDEKYFPSPYVSVTWNSGSATVEYDNNSLKL